MARSLLLLLALPLAPDARALPYTLTPESGTHLLVAVRATHGSTSEIAIDTQPAASDYGGGSSNAFLQGILTPLLLVENFDVSYGPMTFTGTVGVGAMPHSITFNSVSLSYTNNNTFGTLNYPGVPHGGEQLISANVLAGSLAGSLTVDGVEVPFSFSSSNFCAQLTYCWPGINDLSAPARTFVLTPADIAFNQFGLYGFSLGGGGMRTVLVDGATLAEVGGITYSLNVSSDATRSVLQAVPEPGTTALLGLGLGVLGAAGRLRPPARRAAPGAG